MKRISTKLFVKEDRKSRGPSGVGNRTWKALTCLLLKGVKHSPPPPRTPKLPPLKVTSSSSTQPGSGTIASASRTDDEVERIVKAVTVALMKKEKPNKENEDPSDAIFNVK
ncbi:unnamed protein product [Cylicocyclus nassatus]|uniref:Uncharacterized protein n=1 Tax=Cylicocyclus nassatus TaxID=53992 RepID=A0AA36MEF8_CYLNA|nr:unnamed protein product [Cylicocyclus nassatus]